MDDLKLTHRFKSGTIATLTVERKENTRPKVLSDFAYQTATAEDQAEYLQWRAAVVATLMSTLTPGEVFATAEHTLEMIKSRQ